MKKKTVRTGKKSTKLTVRTPQKLFKDIRAMIEETRGAVATAVNAGMTMLYWRIGDRVHREILKGKRAKYGAAILPTLSAKLVPMYGTGFSEKNLRRMVQFADIFPENQIVVTLSRQLGWSHFVSILPIKDPLARDFYAEMCRVERWSVRTLRKKLDSMLYERTALSRKPKKLARLELAKLKEEDKVTPDLVFKDPYILDFLGLRDRYMEKDLEDAILRELENFLLELGIGFTFIARQKRIQIDNDDFYIDLLFYNRKLKRLVAIDLKLGDFKVAYKGQMELYLRWLDKHEKEKSEESPLGIILCAGKKKEQIELLELGRSGIHVAEYLTVLPPKKVLKKRLHEALADAHKRLETKTCGCVKADE